MSSDTRLGALWKSRPGGGIDGATLPGVLANGSLAVRCRSRTDTTSAPSQFRRRRTCAEPSLGSRRGRVPRVRRKPERFGA